MIIYLSSQLVFKGSADSQVFLIDEEKKQKSIISFTGFLNTTSDSLDKFRVSDLVIYNGNSVDQIRETSLTRSKDNTITEHHSFRRFDLTPGYSEMIVRWLFEAEDIEYFN